MTKKSEDESSQHKKPGEPTEAKAPPKTLFFGGEKVILMTAYIWDPDVPAPGPVPDDPWKAIDVLVKMSDLEEKVELEMPEDAKKAVWFVNHIKDHLIKHNLKTVLCKICEKTIDEIYIEEVEGPSKEKEPDDPPAKPIKLRGI